MPSIADVLNRIQARRTEWVTGLVVSVTGRVVMVQLDNGTLDTLKSIGLNPLPVTGNRVLLVITPIGVFCIGVLT